MLTLVLVSDVQPNHREEMLAARRRFQEQYNAQLKEAAKAKEDVSADVLLLRNSTVLFQYLYTIFFEPNWTILLPKQYGVFYTVFKLIKF